MARPAVVPKESMGKKLVCLAFGVFLGLVFWKLGNPVVLESKVARPESIWEAWPLNWGLLMLAVLVVVSFSLAEWRAAKAVPRYLL